MRGSLSFSRGSWCYVVFVPDILARVRSTDRPSRTTHQPQRLASKRHLVSAAWWQGALKTSMGGKLMRLARPVADSAFVTLTVAGTAGAFHSTSLETENEG